MNLTGADRWYVLGQGLVQATRDALSASVERCGMVPGEIVWDDCNCGGVLMVSLPRMYRSEIFPEESEAPVGVSCHAPYEVAEYAVSVARCAPVPQGQDTSVPASDLDTTAGLLAQDMTESMAGLHRYLCGLQRDDTLDHFMVGPAETVGPEGDCVAFTLRVRVGLAV